MSFLKTSTCLFIIKSRLEEDRLLSQKPRLMTRESVRWAKEPGSGVNAVQVPRVESPTPLSPAGPRKGRLCCAIRNQYKITRTAYAQHACEITSLHKRGFYSNMTTAREASLKHLR